MARPARRELDEETIPVPRTVRFPVELVPPDGFDPVRLETWPRVAGRLEWVGGRLLYMPPCARLQRVTVADLVTTLGNWGRRHPEFEVGTNEAGMALAGAVRAADAAVWRRTGLGADSGFARVPPVLAAEVAGRDESEAELREKAHWYLDAGVAIVWCLFPERREVLVLTGVGESRHRERERLPLHSQLPELAPLVDELFAQVAAHGG